MISTLNSITEAPRGAAHQGDAMAKRSASKSLPARRPKVAPAHPGVGIGQILEDIGLSVRKAALAMQVTPMALHNIINGTAAISPEMAVRLEKFMSNGPQGAEFWLRLQGDYDLWHARAKLKDEVARIAPAPREPKAA